MLSKDSLVPLCLSPAAALTFFEQLLSQYIWVIKRYGNCRCTFHTCKKATAYIRFLKHVKQNLNNFFHLSQLSLDSIRPSDSCLQLNWNVWNKVITKILDVKMQQELQNSAQRILIFTAQPFEINLGKNLDAKCHPYWLCIAEVCTCVFIKYIYIIYGMAARTFSNVGAPLCCCYSSFFSRYCWLRRSCEELYYLGVLGRASVKVCKIQRISTPLLPVLTAKGWP